MLERLEAAGCAIGYQREVSPPLAARPSARGRARSRRLRPWIDPLEARTLLSTTPLVVHPMFELGPLVANAVPPSGAFTPVQIEAAYRFNHVAFGTVAGDGSGETIAIVDAYDAPSIQSDLNTFDAQLGLPGATVVRINQSGGTSVPAADSTGGWELEESLDVEWAHAMAPGAKLLLVEAASANDTDLLAAVDYASAHANVVSMSWGGSEFSGEAAYDTHFSRAGVSFVASSGDAGAPASWPAASPDVLAVGGTVLALGANSIWSSETGWSGSGGGPSAYEARPPYQAVTAGQTSTRSNPDVAYDASPSTGIAVYDSFPY
jgi:subtilase family serine protease